MAATTSRCECLTLMRGAAAASSSLQGKSHPFGGVLEVVNRLKGYAFKTQICCLVTPN